jgi:hypothetical protein
VDGVEQLLEEALGLPQMELLDFGQVLRRKVVKKAFFS